MIKRFFSIALSLVLLLSFLTSCSSGETFSFAEFEITLDSDFYEDEESEKYDLVLTNGEATVAVSIFSFVTAGFDGILSVEKFAEHILSETGKDATLSMYGNVPYYTYYEESKGIRLFCSASFARSKYAYFLILSTTLAEREAEWCDKFLEFSETIKFTA